MMNIGAIARKMRDNRRLVAILAVVTVLVAIVSFPMRLALAAGPFDQGPVQIFSAGGTVWDGQLNRVNIGPAGLGNMDAALQFWPLFVGRQSFSLDTEGDAQSPGRATLASTPGGYEVSDMNAALPLDSLLAPLPAGQLRFDDFDVRFSGGKCLSASGRLSLTLRPFLSGLDSDEQLVGAPRCSDDRLLLPLANGAGTRQLHIYIDSGGDYRATLRLEALPDIEPMLLQGRGFERRGGRWQMQLDGGL